MTAVTRSLRPPRVAAAPIRLHVPVEAGPDGTRPNYVPQRSLGSGDFTLEARYLDWRLRWLAAGAIPGVIDGLSLSPSHFPPGAGHAAPASITVQPGLGVTADGVSLRLTAPLTAAWADLTAVWTGAAEAGAPSRTLADGAYLIAVRPLSFETLHGALPDPSARDEVDPTLDERLDTFIELMLSDALPIPFALPATQPGSGDGADWDLALNRLAASLTRPIMLAATGGGLPLGLVIVRAGAIALLSQATGRLVAAPDAERTLLLAQLRETLARLLPATGTITPEQFKAAGARFRFLPASGELPLTFLLDPAAPIPTFPLLPPGLNVTLAVLRSSRVAGLLQRESRRAPIDLAVPTNDALTLLLAVPDPLWSPGLLDIPRADPLLPADLFAAYIAALTAQIAAAHAWDALYGGLGASMTDTARPTLNFLLAARNDPTMLARIPSDNADTTTGLIDAANDPEALATALKTNQIALPDQPDAATVQTQLDTLGYRIEQPRPAPPTNPDDALKPLLPALPDGVTLAAWLDFTVTVPPADDTTPALPGLLLKLATLQQAYALLGQITRGHQIRLDMHGRLQVLQRQHLDVLSSYGSALAGGVPADGTGLQFARLIPFIKLDADAAAPSTPPGMPAAEAVAPAATPPATPAANNATTSASTSISTVSRLSQPFAATTGLNNARAMRIGTSISDDNPAALASTDLNRSQTVLKSAGIVSNLPRTGTVLQTLPRNSVSSIFLTRSEDVASNVASQVGALTQQPQFDFSTTNYGQAKHIAPATDAQNTLKSGLDALRDLGNSQLTLGLTSSNLDSPTDEGHAYGNMMVIGRDVLNHIQTTQAASLVVEARYRRYRDRLQSLEQQIAAVQAAIPTARAALADAVRNAAAAGGTYASAQHLVQEEVDRIATVTASRSKAFDSATGLFWVRQRETAIARDLTAPLPLDPIEPGDLVPGCAADHDGPPSTVLPFLDWVLELPAYDWRPLRPLWPYLPETAALPDLAAFRTARLGAKAQAVSFGTSAAASILDALHADSRIAFGQRLLTTAPSPAMTVAATQQNALRYFAIHDLFTLPGTILRRQAEQLRQRMETACGCLYEKLQDLPPSARFDLSGLATRDALDALSPATWPLTGIARADAFETVRSITALVAWLQRQVADTPSALALPALSRLIRATIIASAYGQPDQALSGSIITVPPRFTIGTPIRITLNQPTRIGTLLDVHDETQAVVGQVTVEDIDAAGVSARIIRSNLTGTLSTSTALRLTPSRSLA